MDDNFFDPRKNDFPQEIGEVGEFGIIEEEEKENKKRTKEERKSPPQE